jgi:acyl-CoA thioesterase I
MKKHILFITTFLTLNVFAADPMAPIETTDYKAQVRISCIGDSITEGSGLGQGFAYPSQLQRLLGNDWKVENFGVSGRTLLKKGDYPYWNEGAYQRALQSSPDVVIIMLGTNDTKSQNWQFEADFVADYTALVQSFRNLASKPRIYICRPCPVPEPGNFGINQTNVLEEIKRIDQIAKNMKLGVIDMYAALVDRPELLPDRVHPNREGAGEMAKAAAKVLTGRAEASSEKLPKSMK